MPVLWEEKYTALYLAYGGLQAKCISPDSLLGVRMCCAMSDSRASFAQIRYRGRLYSTQPAINPSNRLHACTRSAESSKNDEFPALP